MWRGRIVSESALSTRINAARAVVGDNGEAQRLIKTLPRRGFRFVGAVVEDDGLVAAAKSEALPAVSDKPSVAVLPFTNLSGIRNRIIFPTASSGHQDRLSRNRSFRVIARNSAFTYKGKAVDIKQVARELNVQ